MSATLTRAIVRPPARTFAKGLTTARLGKPDLELALQQHARYCEALQQCGLELIRMPPDPDHPDSTFVEDPAIVTALGAVITRPGAASRRGETDSIGPALQPFFDRIVAVEAPGTLDGGDICQVGSHFFIGRSERSNASGARQLAGLLESWGYSTSQVDVADRAGVLHLKSVLSDLGDNRLVCAARLADHPAFRDYDMIRVNPAETYGANLLRINEYVVISAGYPKLEANLRSLDYPLIVLDMSEFRKMDGALTCLSLRF